MAEMKVWHVYLLFNVVSGRTYIGSTVDVSRRLRQHNGVIKGGARSTARGAPHWRLHCHLVGFENRSVACRWERILKCRARGFVKRVAAFEEVGQGRCPVSRNETYPVPPGLQLWWEE